LRGLLLKSSILVTALSLFLIKTDALPQDRATCKEIRAEIEKLTKLKELVESEIKKNQELLKKIEEERKILMKEKAELERRIGEIESQRYKKLAEMFSKMDPELAGQKLSAISDPKEAAYILYNMKPRKAGEVLNYVDPKVVNEIVKILTEIKPSPLNGKPSPKS